MADDERNLVFNSWLRSYVGGGPDAGDYENVNDFYREYEPTVRALVDRSTMVVATLRENPDAALAWMAIEGDALHYVLVKPRWRRLGVARWMLADYVNVPVVYTHTTSLWKRFPVSRRWKFRRWRVCEGKTA